MNRKTRESLRLEPLAGERARMAQLRWWLDQPLPENLEPLSSEDRGWVEAFARAIGRGGAQMAVLAWRSAREEMEQREEHNRVAKRHCRMSEGEIRWEALDRLARRYLPWMGLVKVRGENFYTSLGADWLERVLGKATLAVLNPRWKEGKRLPRPNWGALNDGIRLGGDGMVVINPESGADGVVYGWTETVKVSFDPQPPIWLGPLNKIRPLVGRQESWAPVGVVVVRDREEGVELATLLTVGPHACAQGLQRVCEEMRTGVHRVEARANLLPGHFLGMVGEERRAAVRTAIDGTSPGGVHYGALQDKGTHYLALFDGKELDVNDMEMMKKYIYDPMGERSLPKRR